MKRSEAISLIHHIIYNDPFNDDIAIILLDKLEEAGMRPPRHTKKSESNEVEAFEGWEDE